MDIIFSDYTASSCMWSIEFYMPEDEKPQLYLRSNIPGYPSLEDGTRPERPGYMMPGDRWRDITQLQRTVRLEFSENPSL